MCWTGARSACILRRAGLTHVQSRIFLGAGDRGLRLVRQADQPAARCVRAAARRQARPEILNPALTSARMPGFGFVTFKDAAVASRVTACTQHTIDRRDVRARGSAGVDVCESPSRAVCELPARCLPAGGRGGAQRNVRRGAPSPRAGAGLFGVGADVDILSCPGAPVKGPPRLQVEAKPAVPRDAEHAAPRPVSNAQNNGRKCGPGPAGLRSAWPTAHAERSARACRFFVGGLAPSVDEVIFRRYFERYGEVRRAARVPCVAPGGPGAAA